MTPPRACKECRGRGISYRGRGGEDHMNAHLCKRCSGTGNELKRSTTARGATAKKAASPQQDDPK